MGVMSPSSEPWPKRTPDARGKRNAIASMRRFLCSIGHALTHKFEWPEGRALGRLEPSVPIPVKVIENELCDQCHVAEAHHKIHVGELVLYLCNHHWYRHLVHIIARGYEHKEIK